MSRKYIVLAFEPDPLYLVEYGHNMASWSIFIWDAQVFPSQMAAEAASQVSPAAEIRRVSGLKMWLLRLIGSPLLEDLR